MKIIGIVNDYYNMTNRDLMNKYNIGHRKLYEILSDNNIELKGLGYNFRNNKYHYKGIHIKKNYINEQILYGSLLGDGCIHRPKNRMGYQYTETHSIKQKDYLLWKNVYFNITFGYYNTSVANKVYKICSIYSSVNDSLCKELRKEFYPNGKKVITRKILDKINELGLLVWYLDDGTFNKRWNYIKISTNSFTHSEHKIIQKWFKDKWNLDVRIHRQKDKYTLYFPVLETRKLLNILKSIFVKYKLPKCMKYKLWRE